MTDLLLRVVDFGRADRPTKCPDLGAAQSPGTTRGQRLPPRSRAREQASGHTASGPTGGTRVHAHPGPSDPRVRTQTAPDCSGAVAWFALWVGQMRPAFTSAFTVAQCWACNWAAVAFTCEGRPNRDPIDGRAFSGPAPMAMNGTP